MSTSLSSKQRRQLVKNDRGFGLKASLIRGSRNPLSLWFYVHVGDCQREWLEKVIAGDAETGVVEFRFADGRLWAHVSVTEPVEVYEPGDVETVVGLT